MRKFFIVLMTAIASVCYAQQSVTLDRAIAASTVYLAGQLEHGAKVALMPIDSPGEELSEYILDELTAYIVNEGKLVVVDRRNMELLLNELDFQLSPEVNDETAQSIGKILGVQYIISGSFSILGDLYRLRVGAIAVETAQITAMLNLTIQEEPILAALLGKPYEPRVAQPMPASGPSAQSGSSVQGGSSAASAPRDSSPTAQEVLARARAIAAPTPAPAPDQKPVKKIPVARGNFEVIQGTSRYIRAPIDMQKFQWAAEGALRSLRFMVEKVEPGGIVSVYRHSTARWVRIRLCYWEDEYWFEYLDSQDLRADPWRNRIHRNYYTWIENLEKEIERLYRR